MAENPYSKYVSNENIENPYAKYAISESSIKNPETDQVLMSTEPPTPEGAGEHPNIYGIYGAVRELYKTVGKPAIEAAGMIGGGIIGAGSGLLAGGLGAIPGSAIGAGLGYAGARNLTGAIDTALETERGTKNTLPKIIKSTAQDIALGSIGAGTPAKSLLQREIGALGRTGATPISEEAAKAVGITLRPAEITGSKTLAQVESLLEQVPFASDVMQKWAEKNELKPLIALRNKYLSSGKIDTPQGEQLGQQIKEAIDKRLSQFDLAKTGKVNELRDDILKKLGSNESYESLSKNAQEILATKSASAVEKKNSIYRAVDEVMPQVELPFNNYQETAQSNLSEISKLPNADKNLINVLRWGTDVKQSPEEIAFLKNIEQYPPNIQQKLMTEAGIYPKTEIIKDWKTMQSHRNQLNDLIKQNDLSIKNGSPALKGQLTKEGRIYKQLRDAIDRDFEQIAKEQGGEVLERFKTAQAFYANEYSPIWKQKTIRSMAYKNPDQIIDVAIKKGSTTEIDLVKKALGEQEFNKTIKPAFTNKLLGAGKDAPFDPMALQRIIASYGDETLLKVYSRAELNALKDVAKTGRLLLDRELPNASLLKSFSKNPNNVIVDSILGAIDSHAGSTKVLKNITALNDFMSPQQKKGLELELINRVFRVNPVTEQVEALTMAKNIDKYKETLKKYFSEKDLRELDKIAAIGKQMSRAQQMAANPSGTAKNVIAWGLANQVIFSPLEPLTRGDVAESGKRVGLGLVTAVLAPKILARLYLNPKTRQLLIKGMATPNYTQQGKDIARQLAIVIGNEAIND